MTIEGFRKRDTSITIDGNVVDLQYPIYDALEAGGLAILRLNYYNMPPDDPLKGRNIVALDRNGKEVWRIEPFWHTVESNDRSRKVPAAYTGIDLGEDGKLNLNWIGTVHFSKIFDTSFSWIRDRSR